METIVVAQLSNLKAKIAGYGKENLEDILHVLLGAVALITRQNRCRVYLEDLTDGILVCSAANGAQAQAVKGQSFPLNNTDYLVSRVYMTQQATLVEDVTALAGPSALELADRFKIRASYLVPLIHQGRSAGVLSVDSSRVGRVPAESQRRVLREFLAEVVPLIDQARKYHQQIVLARRIDKAKKKEAALLMVKSAVRLIDKLTLASVLIPSPLGLESKEEGLQVLASYTKDQGARQLYEDEKLINLGPGQSLLSRYISSAGIISWGIYLKLHDSQIPRTL